MKLTQEDIRLEENRSRIGYWSRWGPYLSERAWGTVREDYSPDGSAWAYFPHDHARSRVYRWNEDGIAGISDRHQIICFALAFWNGVDPILKERLYGLTGPQGNHGEDVKECYYYLDSTPTHSYMRYLYKYPQRAFPYSRLDEEARRRGKADPEFELTDTGIFDESRYFDVTIEYAKASPEDIAIRITAINRGPDTAPVHLLPTIWFRNTWCWDFGSERPVLRAISTTDVLLETTHYGSRYFLCEGTPDLLFTENETNHHRLTGAANASQYVKDGFHEYVIHGAPAINPEKRGTKCAAHYAFELGPGEEKQIYLRLSDSTEPADLRKIFAIRQQEADEFYASIIPENLSADAKNVMRQALGGLLWSKQFYHYVVNTWLKGDPAQPPPPHGPRMLRNSGWSHLYNADVISMPDKWEYPWYAAWDLAFHCVALAVVDSDFAKDQLVLMMREWYMHPNGQLPAYEWNFSDVNPPVHAWAAWRVYKIEKKRRGAGDRRFLQRVFHKLLLNFTWWVNRKDAEGRNVFEGGFLGLDNIGVFDRSAKLPFEGRIEQADGTGWMAMFSLNMLAIAIELAQDDPAYEDVASKFWEHFLYIAHAMNHLGKNTHSMWSEEDGFFYDVLQIHDKRLPLKVRSMVGLIPFFAVGTLEPRVLSDLEDFHRRLNWFIENRPDLTANVASMHQEGAGARRLLSVANESQLRRVLAVLLDEREFLSPHGIRSLSKAHGDHPFSCEIDGREYRVGYEPGESTSGMFGGNSNWRGPIWFPLNVLLIESLQKYHHYFGDSFTVEFPTGSGNHLTLEQVAKELSCRLSRLLLRDENGVRAANGTNPLYRDDPNWKDLVLFYEYFDGDTGSGLGANHQTGWTGLVAKLLQQSGE